MRSSTRRRWRDPTARWPCRCHPHRLRARPGNWPTNARHSGWRSISRSGACTSRGGPGWAIAQQLGIGKNTVYRYLRTETLPERQRRADRGRSILTPYHAYLLERWNAGHRDALRLFRELQQRGYAGSYPTVARYAQRLRQAQGQTPRQRKLRQTLPVVAEPASRHLTARRATWLVLRRPERLNDDEAAQLAQLQAQHPELAGAIALAQDFTRLVRERQPDQLEPWLARAAESPHVPLQRFAKGLRDDYDAVKAGVTLPWSHGPVEGQITSLENAQAPDVWPCQPRFAPAALSPGGVRLTLFDGGYRTLGSTMRPACTRLLGR